MFNIYRQALIDIKKKLYNYTQAYPNLSFSSRLEVERLFHVADEIDNILSQSYGTIEDTIKNHSAIEAEQGYYGVWYALEQSQEIILQMPLINHDYVMNLVNAPVAGKRLSKRLYEYRDELAQNVTNNIINGLFEGKSYAEIAKRVSNEAEASYKNALRIAITEGGRTSSITQQKSSEEAASLGIEMEKRWLSTLDGKTRDDHRKLDGQQVPIDGEFEIHGHKAKQPRMFGVAKEDIRCRCTSINIVNGVAPELRKDNDTKKLIKYQNYNEWIKDVMEDPERKLTHFKNKNREADSELFNRYATILKKVDFPKSLDAFQEMKYNGGRQWKEFQDNYFVQSRLRDGRWGSVLNPEKQTDHMESTRKQGKSFFADDVDVQKLFDLYAGTGTVGRDRKGRRRNTEIIFAKEFVGTAVNQNGEWQTNYFKIHYSKGRLHIVPIKEKGDKS